MKEKPQMFIEYYKRDSVTITGCIFFTLHCVVYTLKHLCYVIQFTVLKVTIKQQRKYGIYRLTIVRLYPSDMFDHKTDVDYCIAFFLQTKQIFYRMLR